MTEKATYVYQITNTVNGMRYIGVTRDPRKRFLHHCSNPNSKSKSYLRDAIKKYGKENFRLEILLIGERRYCFELEQKIISKFNTLSPNGYNICGGGEGVVATLKGEKSYWFGKKRDPNSVERSRINNSGEKNYKSKKYVAISPDGVEYRGIGLSRLCKEHNLNVRNLSSVALGRRKHHLGWTAYYV